MSARERKRRRASHAQARVGKPFDRLGVRGVSAIASSEASPTEPIDRRTPASWLRVPKEQPRREVEEADRRQAGIDRRRLDLAAAREAVGLRNPVLDGLTRCRLAGKIGRIAAGTDQIDHLPPEFGGVCGTGLDHWENTARGVSIRWSKHKGNALVPLHVAVAILAWPHALVG